MRRPPGERSIASHEMALAASDGRCMEGVERKGVAMIESKRSQRGDVVITKTVDGFWTHRQLDDSQVPIKVGMLGEAIATGRAIADLQHVDLWLMDDDLQLRVLVSGRRVGKPDLGGNGFCAGQTLSKRRRGGDLNAQAL